MSLSTPQVVGWFRRPFGMPLESNKKPNLNDVAKWRQQSDPSLFNKTTNGTYLGAGVLVLGLLSAIHGVVSENTSTKLLGGLASVGGLIIGILGAIIKPIEDSTNGKIEPLEKPLRMIFSPHGIADHAIPVNKEISSILDKSSVSRPVVIWFERTSPPNLPQGRALIDALKQKLPKEYRLDLGNFYSLLTDEDKVNPVLLNALRSIYDECTKVQPTESAILKFPNPFTKAILNNLSFYKDKGIDIQCSFDTHTFEMFLNRTIAEYGYRERVKYSIAIDHQDDAINDLRAAHESLNKYLLESDEILMKKIKEDLVRNPNKLHIVVRGSDHRQTSQECAENIEINQESSTCVQSVCYLDRVMQSILVDTSPEVTPKYESDSGKRELVARLLLFALKDESQSIDLSNELFELVTKMPIEVIDEWMCRDNGMTTVDLQAKKALSFFDENKDKLTGSTRQALEKIINAVSIE